MYIFMDQKGYNKYCVTVLNYKQKSFDSDASLLQYLLKNKYMINLFTKNAPYRKQFNQQVFHNPNFPSSPIQPEQKTNPLPSQDNLGQLVDLLKTFITQNSDAIKQANKTHLQSKFDIEARDKQVFIALPQIPTTQGEKIAQKVLKLWIAQVTKTVFSSAFYEHSKGNMSFQQTKIYCSENILKNLSRLNQKYNLSPKQFELINKHLVSRILPYLGEKYPLTDSTQINKKLLSLVEEIDNIEELQNNYFTHSKIYFEYRKDGNYYDLIMKVINDLLNKIDNPAQSGKTNFQQFQKFMRNLFQKVYDSEWMNRNEDLHMTFLEECLKYIEPLQISDNPLSGALNGTKHKKEQDKHILRHESESPQIKQKYRRKQRNDQWQKQKERDKQARKQRNDQWQKQKERDKQARKQQKKRRQQLQKYKLSVKQYTSFLIGRKIPENVPLFSEEQINQNKISIKHPAILRILTKWFEQLWKKFEKNFFANRSQSIKLQKGDIIHDLKPQYRNIIDKLMSQQKKKINIYIENIQKLNYRLQSNLLKIEQFFEGEGEMNQLQRICGKFSYKIVKNLHNEIIEYLNKVIHSILLVSKRFHQYIFDPKKYNQSQKSNWPFPPNLISFKVGDLIRCKLSSKQKQIIKIYNQLTRISRSKQYNKKFKIVRIKNRLKDSTNDILINIRFNQDILCEIQLAIKTHASDFIKKSNAFHHYIYQLERSQFGPITQLCSIWVSLDNRAKIYEDLVSKEILNEQSKVAQTNCKCSDYMIEMKIQQPFICCQCTQIYLHSNYILKHTKCGNCFKYFICAKCRIFQQDFQTLKNKLLLDKKIEKESQISNKRQLRDNCVKLINKGWKQFQNQKIRYGLSIFIQSQKIKIKTFKLIFYNSKKYLLGRRQNGQFYELGDINSKQFLRELQTQNILIQIKQNQKILKFDDIEAIKEYIVPKLAKQSYQKYKESIVLHVKISDQETRKLNNPECTKILMSGNKFQREKIQSIFAADNQLRQIPCDHQNFPNIQWLVLSRNPIASFDGLQNFKFLRVFIMQNDDLRCSANTSDILSKFSQFQYLQKLILSHFDLKIIPSSFQKLKRLKCVQLEHCSLNEIQNLEHCLTLEKINLSHNNLNKLPEYINQLHRLQTLILHQNPIEIISNPLYCLRNTQKRDPHLLNLDLSECNIKQLYLNKHSLINLQSLNLERNLLSSIEPQIFNSLTKLKILNLSNNNLKIVPNILPCTKLTKLYVNFNEIEQLPQFLGKTAIIDFKFEGCPIKKIECVEWLKNIVDESTCILQKFVMCYEKIPVLNHHSFNSKYVTKLLNSQEDEKSSQTEQKKPKGKILDILHKTSNQESNTSIYDSDGQDASESKSQSESLSLQKLNSYFSSNFAKSFFHVQKRFSFQSHEQNLSQSQSDQEQELNVDQFRTSQQIETVQFEQQITVNLTKDTIDKYFAQDQIFVFDFQNKIKHLQDNIIRFMQFNFYHDETQAELPQKFVKMVDSLGYSHSVINIYSGKFENIKEHYEQKKQSSEQNKQLLYQDLRKDKIPFSCITTLNNHKCASIRNIELRQLPTHILDQNLQKLTLYKTKSIPQKVAQCTNLKYLKIRKSNIPIMPAFLGSLLCLQQLNLNKNMIQSLQHEIFFELVHLKVLLLQQNKLKQMPQIYRCIRLEKLSISLNPIQVIPEQMNLLANLKQFNFQKCPIKSINCTQWLIKKIDMEESIIHYRQLFLAKLHNTKQLSFSNECSISKLYKWSEKDQDQVYQPFNQIEENKALIFQYKFNQVQFSNRFKEEEFLAMKFIKKMKHQYGQMSYYHEIKVIIDKAFPNTITNFKAFLKLYGLQQIKITLSQASFIDLPNMNHPQCYLCKQKIDYPFYWLKWQIIAEQWLNWQDKPKFGCRKCIESKGQQPEEYYKYKQNSILMFKKLKMYKMPADHIGLNLQPKSQQNLKRHNFECLGCKKKYFLRGEPRYMCLGCKTSFAQKKEKFVDMCQDCIDGLSKKDEKLIKKLGAENHRNWHPILRILFNTQGYYKY